MQFEDAIRKHAAIIERLWWALNKNFVTCRIPASEARLFGSSLMVFECHINDLKGFAANPGALTYNKEKTGEVVFDAVISAATIFKYIDNTIRKQGGLPLALLIATAIQEELFSMMEDCQNFIMEK